MRNLTPLLTALLITAFSLPLEAQDADRFMNSVRDIDSHAEIVIDAGHAGDGVAQVAVSKGWNRLTCEQRKKLAGSLLVMWERAGGDRMLIARHGDRVAHLDPYRPQVVLVVDGCEVARPVARTVEG